MGIGERIYRNIRVNGVREFAGTAQRFVRGQVADLIAPETGPGARRDKYEDCEKLCSTPAPMIVDCGAFKGSTIKQFRQQFDSPEIYAFEPNPNAFETLKATFSSPRIHLYPYAVSSTDGESTLHVTHDPGSASLRQSTRNNVAAFGDQVETKQTVTVETRRLDTVLDRPPTIVKLDIQGQELEALRGLERYIDNISLVLLEVSFREMYEGQPKFCTIDQYMTANGFSLFNLYELTTGRSGKLSQADALYVQTAG